MCITLNLQNIDLNKALVRALFFYLLYALVYFLNPLHQLIKGHGHPIFNTAILTEHDSAFSKPFYRVIIYSIAVASGAKSPNKKLVT